MLNQEQKGQLGNSTTIAVLEKARIEPLKASLRGELIEPGDDGYETARKVYNGMIDKHPALIVRCADVADVTSATRTSIPKREPSGSGEAAPGATSTTPPTLLAWLSPAGSFPRPAWAG